jgi:hypothetical protein
VSRWRLALATVPTREDWLFACGLLLIFAGVALHWLAVMAWKGWLGGAIVLV